MKLVLVFLAVSLLPAPARADWTSEQRHTFVQVCASESGAPEAVVHLYCECILEKISTKHDFEWLGLPVTGPEEQADISRDIRACRAFVLRAYGSL